GQGTKKDLGKAIYWWEKAAKYGERGAQYNLGECYELGIGVTKDEKKAFEYYKKSAENGDLDAQFYLGYCYVNGIGIKVDKEKGFELYNQASGKNDDDNAPIIFGLLYKNEEEIVNDLDKVNYWYCKSAENDNKIALYKLGEC